MDALMVVSFMAVFAGGYIGLLLLVERTVRWVLDSGLFWYVATPVVTLIWMAHLST